MSNLHVAFWRQWRRHTDLSIVPHSSHLSADGPSPVDCIDLDVCTQRFAGKHKALQWMNVQASSSNRVCQRQLNPVPKHPWQLSARHHICTYNRRLISRIFGRAVASEARSVCTSSSMEVCHFLFVHIIRPTCMQCFLFSKHYGTPHDAKQGQVEAGHGAKAQQAQ